MSDDERTNVLSPEQEARAEALMAARRALVTTGFASGTVSSGYELVQVAHWIMTGEHFTLNNPEAVEGTPEDASEAETEPEEEPEW